MGYNRHPYMVITFSYQQFTWRHFILSIIKAIEKEITKGRHIILGWDKAPCLDATLKLICNMGLQTILIKLHSSHYYSRQPSIYAWNVNLVRYELCGSWRIGNYPSSCHIIYLNWYHFTGHLPSNEFSKKTPGDVRLVPQRRLMNFIFLV